MKRKITDLERYFLTNGFTLVGKKYDGKYSQFTSCYIYSKKIMSFNCEIHLNKKRDNVIGVFVSGLSTKEITEYQNVIDELKNIIKKGLKND